MTGSDFTLDMTLMLTIHRAFRRELRRIATVAARTDDDPRHILRNAIGWRLFTRYLTIHHTTEDDTVWGPMHGALAGRPDELALLGAMEAEHAAIDPLLNAIDAALADRDHGHERFGGLVDELATGLCAHLDHEEDEGLALIDAVLTPQQWAHFASVHVTRVGDGMGSYLPWLLDGAGGDWVDRVLSRLPDHGRASYEGTWRAAYARLDLWAPAATGDTA